MKNHSSPLQFLISSSVEIADCGAFVFASKFSILMVVIVVVNVVAFAAI